MSQEIINIGAAPNDGTGDPARTAFTKTNDNFGQLFNAPYGLLESTRTTFLTIVIPLANTLVDIVPATVISANTTSDFIADVDGSIKYVGSGGLFKITYMAAIESASGTVIIGVELFRNGVSFASINGGPEAPGDSAPKYIYTELLLVTDDIISSRIENKSNSVNLILREFYMKLEDMP